MRIQKQKGFTLIELLIVIAIIGILATISITSLNTARIKARDVCRISDLRQVALALEMYYSDNTNVGYPGASGSNQWGDETWGMVKVLQDSKYFSVAPSDPGTGSYEYWVTSDNQEYILRAVLENNNDSALDNDIDGIVFGCSCDDPAYCLQP